MRRPIWRGTSRPRSRPLDQSGRSIKPVKNKRPSRPSALRTMLAGCPTTSAMAECRSMRMSSTSRSHIIATRTDNTSAPGNERGRRARYLFSGVVECAECSGNYIMISQTHYGCVAARNKGTCGKPRTSGTGKPGPVAGRGQLDAVQGVSRRHSRADWGQFCDWPAFDACALHLPRRGRCLSSLSRRGR